MMQKNQTVSLALLVSSVLGAAASADRQKTSIDSGFAAATTTAVEIEATIKPSVITRTIARTRNATRQLRGTLIGLAALIASSSEIKDIDKQLLGDADATLNVLEGTGVVNEVTRQQLFARAKHDNGFMLGVLGVAEDQTVQVDLSLKRLKDAIIKAFSGKARISASELVSNTEVKAAYDHFVVVWGNLERTRRVLANTGNEFVSIARDQIGVGDVSATRPAARQA